MPIYQLNYTTKQHGYLVWYIEESEEELLRELRLNVEEQATYSNFLNPKRRLEWLASRLAYQKLCTHMQIPCLTVYKDHNGRPYLTDDKIHISLSHCFPFAVAAINQQSPIGIDIQIPNYKLEVIKEKYLNRLEIENSKQDLEKLCICWCAKEAIFKAYGYKALSFQSINLAPFNKKKQGTIHVQVLAKHDYIVHYYIDPNYVLAWC
ncbi:MAG: 4'-phosphopantetheinyl transferase family protein [Candidatus Amoebophilus sp.]